jgi:hypothetical protein
LLVGEAIHEMFINRKWRAIAAIALCCCLVVVACECAAARQRNDAEKAAKHKDVSWAPADVDEPLRSLSALPPCDVSKVLKEAGARALELTTNLENFTAQEQIEYKKLDQTGFPEESDASAFDYVFAFEQRNGRRISREYRTPVKGGHAFPTSGQDMGQAALALIFLPSMQSDYEMSCEGLDKWNGQFAWVIHFQQRKDKPGRTLEFNTRGGPYFPTLKGRAWISMENSQVLHLETNLMHAAPSIDLQSGATSIDYAPVQIQSRNMELWLPQRVEAYWEISNRRIILYHTFSNFKLFAVDTADTVQKPKQQ